MDVYRGYSQEELNRQYDASATVPAVEPYFERYLAASEAARSVLRSELSLFYGTGERETLDLFAAPVQGAPLFAFIHGGYWRRLSKDYFSYVALPIVRAGGACAVLNYSLAPQVTLDEIVRQQREALRWLRINAVLANASPLHIYVGGHSAGGQLAGLLAGTDWEAQGLEPGFIRGVFGISGLYDLEPVRRSHVNAWMHLDESAAERNSPIKWLPRLTTSLVAAVGGAESDEFKRQTRRYAQTWSEAGMPARVLELPGLNHFSAIFELANAESPLTRALLELMQLDAKRAR